MKSVACKPIRFSVIMLNVVASTQAQITSIWVPQTDAISLFYNYIHGHHPTQQNDIQHHDTQQNDIQHHDTQQNDTQQNDAQQNDTQHNDVQHNYQQNATISKMTLSKMGECCYFECHLF
jgi:hypothetical protein